MYILYITRRALKRGNGWGKALRDTTGGIYSYPAGRRGYYPAGNNGNSSGINYSIELNERLLSLPFWDGAWLSRGNVVVATGRRKLQTPETRYFWISTQFPRKSNLSSDTLPDLRIKILSGRGWFSCISLRVKSRWILIITCNHINKL